MTSPRLLLADTHVVLWALTNDPRLTRRARAVLTGAQRVYVSTASLWEMSIKVRLGKLTLPERFGSLILRERGYGLLPITADHALEVRNLPLHHHDPFDRMLIVQANIEDLTLVSHDTAMQRYKVALLKV
ncbi:MAG: type II toxin-antitoxin system VapC family toxin [Deltaproteobacteria bacterium]|nr:type II toxin-antitoxin system VapC family toxin [Deltaproteobacteria bacterium]